MRLVGNRPYLIRRPSTVTKWDGVPLEVQFKGEAFTAFVSREAIEDLGGLRGTEPEKVWFQVAEKHIGRILDAIIVAFEVGDRWNERHQLIVSSKHFRWLTRPQE